MSISFLTQDYHMYFMCPDIIFPILLPPSRTMTSHHVISHVTSVSHASLSSKKKEKEKENQYKIRKIREKKNKKC